MLCKVCNVAKLYMNIKLCIKAKQTHSDASRDSSKPSMIACCECHNTCQLAVAIACIFMHLKGDNWN